MQIKEPRTKRTRAVSDNRVEVALTDYRASTVRANPASASPASTSPASTSPASSHPNSAPDQHFRPSRVYDPEVPLFPEVSVFRAAILVFAFCPILFLTGCSDYVGDYQYIPRPALAEIAPAPPDRAPPVSVFASIIGIHRSDKDDDIPESVEVRFRIENNGPHTVSFDPQSLQLMTGDLLGLQPPIARPEHPATLAPSEAAIYDAFFPFPPGHSPDNLDLRSLVLRWHVQIDGSTVSQSTTFRRAYPHYYYYRDDPYWGDPWFYGGVVIVRHRR